MRQLFLTLYKIRALLFFVFLEIVALIMLRQNNAYQSAVYFSSANYVVGSVHQMSDEFTEYFSLRDKNKELLEENARLRELLEKRNVPLDTQIQYLATRNRFNFIPCEVINNSYLNSNNYITIDKGLADGIRPGMGVITSNGIVGKVKSCSQHLSTVFSLLHSGITVSSKVKRNNSLCHTKWMPGDYKTGDLVWTPLHLDIRKGDTIVTSSFNSIYPEGTMIGIVRSIDVIDTEPFKSVKLDLSTDFSQIQYVYAVKDIYRAEADSIREKESSPY